MAVGLPLLGQVVRYNGYTFDGTAKVTVQTEFPLDDAGRTILYHRYTIRVQATIALGNQRIDTAMEGIRSALGEPARAFTFTGHGFGNDLDIPAGGDVAGGPMPKVLSWTPIGSNYAAEVEWQVVVCVAVCGSQSSLNKLGILALNYEQSFSIDENGDTTRVTTGYLQIAQNRNGRAIKDSADRYLDRIIVNQPEGFARSQVRSLSKDKARLDFTVTDRQIPSPNAYPPLMTVASGSHRARWSRSRGGAMMLRNTISMELSPKAGISGSQAWQVFGDIAKQRIKIARDSGKPVLIDELEVEEALFGRPCSFVISYRIMEANLTEMLSATGLWVPITRQNGHAVEWAAWHASLSDVFGSRGTAGLQHIPGNDMIVDFCGGSSTVTVDQQTRPKSQPKGETHPLNNDPSAFPKDGGYLNYRAKIVPSSHRPVSRQSILQPPDDPSSFHQSMESANPPRFPPSPGDSASPPGHRDVIQQSGKARYSVALVGSAMRAVHKIPCPSLVRAGTSSSPIEVSKVFDEELVGNWLGVNIYAAKWAISYVLDGSPGEVEIQRNVEQEK